MQSINRLIEKSKNTHKGFTLVEMLIVVAILAVLMTIVFRLGSLGGADSYRTNTIVRMQKIENCLSGYYAAFGSYPPVKVHGWRNIDVAVDENGDQTESNAGGSANKSEGGTTLQWNRVNAACRSQPFGCEYPPCQSSDNGSSEEEIIEDWAEEIKSRIGNSSDYPLYAQGTWTFAEVFQGDVRGPSSDRGFSDEKVWNEPDWKVIKLFKFGVMSYLLPRYLFMMGGDRKFFSGGSDGNGCAQWGQNNDMPSDPFTGESYDKAYSGNGWDSISEFAQTGKSDRNINRTDLAKVANIPSQAVCARWMPNLEGICSAVGAKTFFGIGIGGGGLSAGWEGSDGEVHPPAPGTHTRAGTTYRNASITIYDGWGNEFYYYSPAPYQTYTLWSAGSNGKTFPPWMDLDDLDSNDRKTAQKWKNDDIMQMSH